ncbi:unnamed protein product [Discosporangium mesarthrocarpum]
MPDENWEKQLNKGSKTVVKAALLDPSVLARDGGATPGTPFQIERVGFFVVDPDTTPDLLVINRTITLKEAFKGPPPGKSRKEEQARQRAEKEARKSVPPQEYFLSQTDLYSAFDADGVPTHDKGGEPLSKKTEEGVGQAEKAL